MATLDEEIARQDAVAAKIQASNAHLQHDIRNFLELVADFGEHDGARRWTLATGEEVSGWVIDHGTLLLTTDGRVLRYGHVHLDAAQGGSVWHDWNRACKTGITDVGHLTELPEDLVQLLATTYRDLRDRHTSGDLGGRAHALAAVEAVPDPVERLLRAAYFVARERHDYLLARPVSREDMELLCPEFFPVRIAEGQWGPVDVGQWFAEQARGRLPTSLRLHPGRGWRSLLILVGRRSQVEGWKVGARDRSSRSAVVGVSVDGLVFEQHRRGWRPGQLQPHHLRRMAELLNLT